jgi:hypothetical protein
VAHLPYKIEAHSIAVFEETNTLLVIGGFDGFGVVDTIIKINLRTWESEVICTKMEYKRENHTSQVLNGDTIVIAGGWSSGRSMT